MIKRTGRKFYRHNGGIRYAGEYELLETDRPVDIQLEDYVSYGYLLIDLSTNYIIAVPSFIFDNTFKEFNK
jgi:hypothetical protein